MPDRPLLPVSDALTSRAASIAAQRFETWRGTARDGSMPWGQQPRWLRQQQISCVVAELRPLSGLGLDHACRWLWELTTGNASELCPLWGRLSPDGYMLALDWGGRTRIEVREPRGPSDISGTFYPFPGDYLTLTGVSRLPPFEALHAAVCAAVEWRAGVEANRGHDT